MSKKSSEKVEHKCTLKEILDIMGGKWSIPIISTLLEGTKRFSELERTIPNINTRMLVKELKSMEANEILKREVFATVPPMVEYSLTLKGQKLKPIVDELHKWGNEFVK